MRDRGQGVPKGQCGAKDTGRSNTGMGRCRGPGWGGDGAEGLVGGEGVGTETGEMQRTGGLVCLEDGLPSQGDAGEVEVQRPGGCGRGAPGWRSGCVGMAPMEVTGYGLGNSGDTGSRGRRDRKGRVKVDSGDTVSRVKVESSCRTRWKGQEGAPRSSSTSALDRSAGVWGAALAALLAGRECGWVMNFAPPGSHSCLGHSNPPLPSGQPDPSPFGPSSPCSVLCNNHPNMSGVTAPGFCGSGIQLFSASG